MTDLRLDGFRHAADEHRQTETDRDRVTIFREDTDGKVKRLVDDHVVGSAHEVGLHFLSNCHDAIADDLD
jgi:hypothetical protein